MTQQLSDELSKNRAAYFDMLADVGMTKHLGSLAATDDLVKGCRINADSLVLDVGCGVGLTPCYLARTYGCDVTGVDITPKMIGTARTEARRRGVADATRWAIADAQALPFASGSFDAVLVESVSVFLDDMAQGFREYARVIKPGGYVGVTESTWLAEPNQDTDAFYTAIGGTAKTKEAWLGLMTQAGLVDVTGYARSVDLRVEARGRLKRFGAGGLARIMVRAIRTIVGSKSARRVYKDALDAAPDGVFKLMGYGVFVGRKSSPSG